MTAISSKPTWDNRQIQEDRVRLLQAEMRRRGVGVLFIGGGTNARYALNLKVPSLQLFIPVEGELIAFVRPRDQGYVSAQFENIRPPLTQEQPTEHGKSGVLANGLKALLAEHGLAGERVGVTDLKTGEVIELIDAGMKIFDAGPIIEETSSVKTAGEVEIYHLLGELYVTTFNAFRNALQPGVTEQKLAHVVTSTWDEFGAEDIAQLNVCAGENMNPWRRWPTDRQVRKEEFVGIDLHGRGPSGLRGDGSTTFYVGDHPTDEQRDLYRRATDYLEAVKPLFRTGRPIGDVMAEIPRVPDQFRKKLWDLNYAHGCGLGHSGYPHLDPRQEPINDVLHENQMFSLEVYFGESGSTQAVKLEQMILVREKQPDVIGPIPLDERFIKS